MRQAAGGLARRPRSAARPRRPSRPRRCRRRHALRAAADDADVVDRHADDLAAVGDQHDLVAVLDREGGDQRAVPLVDRHGDDAFAAAPGDPVLVGRRALAVAVLRDGQDELLGGAHLGVALLGELAAGRRLASSLGVAAGLLRLALAAHRAAHLEVGGALGRRRLEMAEDRHRDDACRPRRG